MSNKQAGIELFGIYIRWVTLVYNFFILYTVNTTAQCPLSNVYTFITEIKFSKRYNTIFIKCTVIQKYLRPAVIIMCQFRAEYSIVQNFATNVSRECVLKSANYV